MRRRIVFLSGFAALTMAASAAGAAAPGGEGAAAECTKLAGSPHDVGLTDEGVVFDDIDAAAAIAACETGIAENPSDARLRFQLARALDKAERDGEAMTAYQAAGEAGFALGFTGAGVLHEYGEGVEKDFGKAAEFYRRAADAGEPLGATNLGVMYGGGWGIPTDLAEAERLCRIGLTRGREATIHLAGNQIAWMSAKEGRNLDEAERLARAAVADAEKTEVDHATRLDTLAWVLHKRGKNEEALAEQMKVIALDAEEAVFHAHIGDIYAAAGRNEEARAAWQKALDLPVDESNFDPSYDLEALKAKVADKTSI